MLGLYTYPFGLILFPAYVVAGEIACKFGRCMRCTKPFQLISTIVNQHIGKRSFHFYASLIKPNAGGSAVDTKAACQVESQWHVAVCWNKRQNKPNAVKVIPKSYKWLLEISLLDVLI